MKFESILPIQKSHLLPQAEMTRNKHIQEAYNQLVCRISNMLDNNHNRAWNKYPRFEKHEIKSPYIIQEFYTPVCSVILYLRERNYIIGFSGTSNCFQPGHGVNSTALLRLAFDTTQNDINGFSIYDCLEISISNDIERLYKQKVDELMDLKNLSYFKQKMEG